MKKFFFLLVLLAGCGPAFAQDIFHFSNGSLMQEAVTATITGDFISASVQGGFTPLSIGSDGLDWGGPAIETFGPLFWHGKLSSVNNSLAANPDYWFGPVFGSGQLGSNNISTHGVLGGTVGINLGAIPLSATAVADTATGKVYGGLQLVTQLDFGGGSIVHLGH